VGARRGRITSGVFKEVDDLLKDKAPTESRSDDGFIAPRTEAEEKAAMQKEGGGFWRSEFDDLPDNEKLQSPLVVLTLVLVTLPFAGGVYTFTQLQGD